MGKIFDAMEKAGQPKEFKRAPFYKTNRRRGASKSEKVVPIANHMYSAQGQKLDPNLIAYHAPQSVEAELFKVLRTNLLFPSSGKAPRTIMVTSATPGEGKSFVSANLAVSIAQGVEEHVLLIGADIRRPALKQIFGIEQTDGLSEYLSTGSDVAKYFAKTIIPKLTVLPAGQTPNNPVELLTTQKMRALLKEVAIRYEDRFVIMDTAPASLASETTAIAKYVDGVIIVVRAGKTPRRAVSEVVDMIGREKVLGIVLNDSDQFASRYYGYGKSYYQEGAGKGE